MNVMSWTKTFLQLQRYCTVEAILSKQRLQFVVNKKSMYSLTGATMKLCAKPTPEYVRNPMHTKINPIKFTADRGSAESPIKIFSVKAMFVTGSDKACTENVNVEHN